MAPPRLYERITPTAIPFRFKRALRPARRSRIMSTARGEDSEALTLLEVLARAPAAPAAAAIISASLTLEDRKALRLAHPLLRDAVDACITKLNAIYHGKWDGGPPTPRPPTAQRWPRLEALRMMVPDLAAVEALGSETWTGLRSLSLDYHCASSAWDGCMSKVRPLPTALGHMPALRSLALHHKGIFGEAAGELFCNSITEATPQLKSLTFRCCEIAPAVASALAAAGWRLEELRIHYNNTLGDAGVAALAASPSFALRRLGLRSCGLVSLSALGIATCWSLEELDLCGNEIGAVGIGTFSAPAFSGGRLKELNLGDNKNLGAAGTSALVAAPMTGLRRLTLSYCGLDAAALRALARAHWPLEELDIGYNDLSDDAAGPALAALSRHAGLLRLDVSECRLSPANFEALIESTWPALTSLSAQSACSGALAFSAAAFAGFPKLEKLEISDLQLGKAGARALARQRWPRLRELVLTKTHLRDRGVAALALGDRPALQQLQLMFNDLRSNTPPALARGSFPALTWLDLRYNGIRAQVALDTAGRPRWSSWSRTAGGSRRAVMRSVIQKNALKSLTARRAPRSPPRAGSPRPRPRAARPRRARVPT